MMYNNEKFVIKGSRSKRFPDVVDLRPITLEEAKLLRYGDQVWIIDDNGQAARLRVTSSVKQWKRDPDRIEISFRFGLRDNYRFGTDEILRYIYVPTGQDDLF